MTKLFQINQRQDKLSTQEQISFAKRLSMLLNADIPLLSALAMMEKQTTSKATKQIMGRLHNQVEHGQSLSHSLSSYQKSFGAFAINLIHVGEVSGTLNKNLNYLAQELKKKQELKRRVIGALVYPLFIVFATIGITVLLTAYVFPKILPVFQSFKFKLPWTTRFLIAATYAMQHYWLLMILSLIFLIVASIILLKRPRIRLWLDKNMLRIPVLGPLFKNYHTANFSRTLGLLLASGVAIVESLRIVSVTMSNAAYRKIFNEIAEQVEHGEKITAVMEQHSLLFPDVVTQMAMVGEASGNLSASLLFLAEMHDDELNNLTKNLSTSIEPILMIFMGILVGFIAISIITPIYAITQNLHH